MGAPSAPYMHVGGPHDFARSANSWGTLAAAGNCKQGGWEAPGCSKGCPHIQTVLARAGVCTYETRELARGPRLFERSENMWGGLVWGGMAHSDPGSHAAAPEPDSAQAFEYGENSACLLCRDFVPMKRENGPGAPVGVCTNEAKKRARGPRIIE